MAEFRNLREVLEWPKRFIQDIAGHVAGDAMLHVLWAVAERGILLCTDFSGIGGPEIALRRILGALWDWNGREQQQLLAWSGSDICPINRQVLMNEEAAGGCQHVFGDLLSRCSERTVNEMTAHLTHAKAIFKGRVAAGMSWLNASSAAGSEIWPAMAATLEEEGFGDDDMAWCHKCRKLCRVHGPFSGSGGKIRVKVAGSVCKPWSAMGSRTGWASEYTLPFAVWIYQCAAVQPDLLVHECTENFEHMVLKEIMGKDYDMTSFVFCPTHIGIPSRRKRRYTILLHRRMVMQSMCSFDRLFFRPCNLPGTIYCSAPQDVIEACTEKLAAKQKLPCKRPCGASWTMREVLAPSQSRVLRQYEEHVRNLGIACVFFNLSQTPEWSKPTGTYCPALLTRTGILWNTVKKRLVQPEECFAIMGLPFFPGDSNEPHRFPIQILSSRGILTATQIRFMWGNGMHQAAIGATLLFAFVSMGVAQQESLVQYSQPCDDVWADVEDVLEQERQTPLLHNSALHDEMWAE